MVQRVVGSDYFIGMDKDPRDLHISPKLKLHTVPGYSDLDPTTFEVLRHRLWQINDEQAATIKKISGSPVATEAHDFNVAIADEYGHVVFVGPYVTFHTGIVDLIIKWILENRSDDPEIHDGDMFLCSDPWVGAIHQSDVTIVSPIFYGDSLFCWTACTIHLPDVGGVNPGSFSPSAKDVFAEPLPIPPIKLCEKGKPRRDVWDMFLRRSRVPHLAGLDIRAMIAANNVSKGRILKVMEKYSAHTVKAVMKKSLDYAEGLLRERLQELPDGVWRHIDYIDCCTIGDRDIYKAVLEMTKEGDHLHFDYTGSDPNAGMMNCAYSGGKGGSTTAVLAMLCKGIPWAIGGINRCLSFEIPRGTVINAEFPIGVSMASISATQLSVNCAIQTISKMLASHPEHKRQLLGGCAGSWPGLVAQGIDQRGEPFTNVIMDAVGAGSGARSWRDGDDTGGILVSPGGNVPNVETNELMYPILYLYRKEEIDSGGPGQYRGGTAGTTCYIRHGTDRPITQVGPCWGVALPTAVGLCGGFPTMTACNRLLRKSNIKEWFARGEIPADITDLEGEMEYLPVKYQSDQCGDDVYACHYQGGGGYGDPIDRDPALVAKDVVNGYVSLKAAREIYGVIVDPQSGEVKEAETTVQRENIRKARLA
ncbi:MAG: hydantoinase B/oxoprolinase family protein [Chloroflexi bacterium]|nr:hydantoinase B/oxoprolinase family protein [Chloroflexota bacterium]